MDGSVAEGWEEVRAAFESNFAEGLEKSAQLVISVEGQVVVDLWGPLLRLSTPRPRENSMAIP